MFLLISVFHALLIVFQLEC